MKPEPVVPLEILLHVLVGIEFKRNGHFVAIPSTNPLYLVECEILKGLANPVILALVNILVSSKEHKNTELKVSLWNDIDIVQVAKTRKMLNQGVTHNI